MGPTNTAAGPKHRAPNTPPVDPSEANVHCGCGPPRLQNTRMVGFAPKNLALRLMRQCVIGGES